MDSMVLGIGAILVGQAAVKRFDQHPHSPEPVAWFLAVLTGLLLVGAVVTFCIRGDD